MIRERPKLDRERLLATEANRRSSERLLSRLMGELARGEYLGAPVRSQNQILIPVLREVPVEERAEDAALACADPQDA